jgi:hypothetical protein
LATVGSAVLVAGLVTGAAPTAQADADTCQGRTPTVVGPTSGQNTTGTEGDDVIVAPLSNVSTVLGLGGDDTICLIPGPDVPDEYFIVVRAGEGNDSVSNESGRGGFDVELGGGADSYVGNDQGERVYASAASVQDTEVDVLDLRGGDDLVHTGPTVPGIGNHDVVSTGAGADGVVYGGPAGGTIDNGEGADGLFLSSPWSGELTIDSGARRATHGATTLLTWTSVSRFGIRVEVGSSFGFVGSDAGESLSVAGTSWDLASDSTIAMGGGDDSLRLENFLPDGIEGGDGTDSLGFTGCRSVSVALGDFIACTTYLGQEVDVETLAGVEDSFYSATDVVDIRGTPAADLVGARSHHVSIRGLGGADALSAAARSVEVYGGPGPDTIAVGGFGRATARGGRGDDVLRGSSGRQGLYGGAGQDLANGKRGRDLCRAEVERHCEI